MKKSRFIAILLAALMILSIVAACGPDDSGTPARPDPTPGTDPNGDGEVAAPEEFDWPSEISIFVGSDQRSPVPAPDTAVGQAIQELTGVTLRVEYLVGQDIQQKANLMVAGGVFPDLIFGGDSPGIFIAGGALIPLDDLLESYGQQIKRLYRPSVWDLVRDQNDDNKIYVLPTNRGSVDNLYPGAGWYIAYDALRQLGYPTPRTLDDLFDIIEWYVENNPYFDGQPTIGFSMSTEGAFASGLIFGAARFLSGFPNDGHLQVCQETLTAEIVMKSDALRAFLEFGNRLWHAGLMDREMFMQPNDEFIAKVTSGRVVAIYAQRWQIDHAFSAMEQAGLYERTLVAFPIVWEGATQEAYRGPFGDNPTQGIAITTAASDPAGLMRWLNRMAYDDIQKLNSWGIEGEDYYIDEDGNFQRTREMWDNWLNMEHRFMRGISEFNNMMPRRSPGNCPEYGKFECGNWVNVAFHPDFAYIRYSDFERHILAMYNATTFTDWFAPAYPQRYIAGWAIRQMAQALDDQSMFQSVDRAEAIGVEWNTKLIQADPADFDRLWEEYQALLRDIPGFAEFAEFATDVIRRSARFYE